MIVKNVSTGDEARNGLMSGIRTLSMAVKSTLGARGRTAILESENHTYGITSTKDGVTVAKSINLEDPTENLAVQIVRRAAENTAKDAGDGTTTSVVLAEALIDSANEMISDSNNKTKVIRYMESYVDSIIKKLSKMSTKITGRKIYDIASISANNDKDLGKLIGDAYKYVGKDGMVTVKDSDDKTEVKYSSGIKFDRGVSSQWQMTDIKKRITELDGGVFVLVSDKKLENLMQIDKILAYVMGQGKSILLICELEPDALAALNENVYKKRIKAVNVLPPNFGYRKEEMLSDIANVTGGSYISEQTGTDWGIVDIVDLGYVDRIVCTEDSTTMFSDEIFESEEFESYISSLVEDIDQATDNTEKDNLRNRVAMLSGKLATIYVGGTTDLEQKEKRDRVDDAVLATRAAIDDGILPGGGSALLNISWGAIDADPNNADQMVAEQIVMSALKMPFNQILINAGLDPEPISDELYEIKNHRFGYDVNDDKIVDMIKSGIIDPAKVTKTALKNAVSVATTILSCETVISNVRDYGK